MQGKDGGINRLVIIVVFFIFIVRFVPFSICINRNGKIVHCAIDETVDDAAGTSPNVVLAVGHCHRLAVALFVNAISTGVDHDH